jgi:hypothetical protein
MAIAAALLPAAVGPAMQSGSAAGELVDPRDAPAAGAAILGMQRGYQWLAAWAR